jgi:hypothetical protein
MSENVIDPTGLTFLPLIGEIAPDPFNISKFFATILGMFFSNFTANQD